MVSVVSEKSVDAFEIVAVSLVTGESDTGVVAFALETQDGARICGDGSIRASLIVNPMPLRDAVSPITSSWACSAIEEWWRRHPEIAPESSAVVMAALCGLSFLSMLVEGDPWFNCACKSSFLCHGVLVLAFYYTLSISKYLNTF